MAKIKHIALSTQDPDRRRSFYVDCSHEAGRPDRQSEHTGYYSHRRRPQPGHFEVQNDAWPASSAARAVRHPPLRLFQSQLEDITERLATAGAPRRDDINAASAWAPRRGTEKRYATSR